MEDIYNKQQELNQRIFDKALNDPAFRDQMLADPEGALKAAGLLEEIESVEAELEAAAEVGANCGTRFQGCGYWSSRWYCPGYGWKFGPHRSTR